MAYNYRKGEHKIAQLSFHETYHYYQGLTLPFLFWYSFLCTHIILTTFRELSRQTANFHDWSAIVYGFNNLSEIHRLGGRKGTFHFLADNLSYIQSVIHLTLLDLIESATSLAQYQVSVKYEDITDPIEFKLWTLRNPAYLKVYDFLSATFQDEKLVLRFLIPLINASFKTSQPMRAFIDLINAFDNFIRDEPITFQKFIAQSDPCNWTALFEYIFANYIQFETEPDESAEILNPPYFRLNIENWIDSNFGILDASPLSHPFINFHASEWNSRSKSNPTYSSFMDYPGYVTGDFLKELSRDFFPAISFLRYHIDGINDRVLSFGSLNRAYKYNYPIPIPDLMTIYGVVKRATNVQYVNDHRLCHHTQCPEYKFNYCNSYPIIPVEFERCGFHDRINHLIQILK